MFVLLYPVPPRVSDCNNADLYTQFFTVNGCGSLTSFGCWSQYFALRSMIWVGKGRTDIFYYHTSINKQLILLLTNKEAWSFKKIRYTFYFHWLLSLFQSSMFWNGGTRRSDIFNFRNKPNFYFNMLNLEFYEIRFSYIFLKWWERHQ